MIDRETLCKIPGAGVAYARDITRLCLLKHFSFDF